MTDPRDLRPDDQGRVPGWTALDAARKELGVMSPGERVVRRLTDAAFLAAVASAQALLDSGRTGALSPAAFAATVSRLPDAELVIVLATAGQSPRTAGGAA